MSALAAGLDSQGARPVYHRLAPDAIHSAQYAASILEVGNLEVVGRRRSFRSPARVALSPGRSHAPMARHLRVGWPGPADLGRPLTACLAARRPMRRAFLLAYLCGFLWYMGNCYWVRDTMSRYGDMPPMAPTLLLIGYSLVLGFTSDSSAWAWRWCGGYRQHSAGARRCAHFVGWARAGRLSHHLCALGPAGLLPGG